MNIVIDALHWALTFGVFGYELYQRRQALSLDHALLTRRTRDAP
jgi:hypothetical protein